MCSVTGRPLSFVNAKIALPDAHYEVVDFDGKPSDVVSIAPNADNSCLAYMTANHQVRAGEGHLRRHDP